MTTLKKNHDPDARPLDCRGRYGTGGYKAHKRRGETPCARCKRSANHLRREAKRGQPSPRVLWPCGTWQAAQRHRYHKQALDYPCRVAEAAYQQELRDKKRASA